MTPNFFTADTTACRAVALPFGLRTLLAAWSAYCDARAKRRTVRILHGLDSRTLHDIGVNRTEIESTVYGGGERLRSYRPELGCWGV